MSASFFFHHMLWRILLLILIKRQLNRTIQRVTLESERVKLDSYVVAKFANTTKHGAIEGKTQTHEKEYFNLEMVTSVGYRVKSKSK